MTRNVTQRSKLIRVTQENVEMKKKWAKVAMTAHSGEFIISDNSRVKCANPRRMKNNEMAIACDIIVHP
jgi:hypothetical protein